MADKYEFEFKVKFNGKFEVPVGTDQDISEALTELFNKLEAGLPDGVSMVSEEWERPRPEGSPKDYWLRGCPGHGGE
jgi:hypothetical protein